MKIELVLIFIIAHISHILADEGVLVEISNGKVRGFLDKSYKNRIFSSFEGIPYARPPVGDLRFEPPKEPYNWTGTWVANTKHTCLQLVGDPSGKTTVAGAEDCLYINVYVPREAPVSSDKLPVIVHIHGGAFMMGSAHMAAGPKYLMDEDVILVTMNYRVGPLGFLSTEDEVVPGNNGMKDQAFSLKWIQKNIKYFGGDPNAVTITGMSAGGASVHLHYFSPLSKGLFHRGFSENGNALNPWVLQEKALEKAKRLANAVGCPSGTSKEIISCLKTRSGNEITEKSQLFTMFMGIPLAPFAPVVEAENEGAFMTELPYKMLVEKTVTDAPWVHSVAEQEGYLFSLMYSQKLEEFFDNFDKIAPHLLEYTYTIDENQAGDVFEEIIKYYFPKTKDFDGLGKLAGDRLFVADADAATKLQAKANKSPVYFTIFGYKGEHCLCEMFIKHDCDKIGATHGDEVLYYLNVANLSPLTLSESDEKMKNIFVGWLTSFAKNEEAKMSGVEWEAVKGGETLETLRVKGPDDIKMDYVEDLGSNSFWKKMPFKENGNLLNTDSKDKDEL